MLDRGEGHRGSFAYSRVFVSDSAVRIVLRNVGQNGVDLGTVTLNGTPMLKVPHRISLRQQVATRDTSIIRGVEYVSDLTNSYQPLIPYIWAAPTSPYGALAVGILAPGPLSVQAPVGGSVVSRKVGLPIQWKCGDGSLVIVVSVFDPVSRKSLPILQLKPRTNSGRALLPATVLSQFPAAQQYVFTFILANRKEISLTATASKKMVVQAASVYSVYFEIR
jgi:hypothetical protein